MWLQKLGKWTAEQLIFIDESGFKLSNVEQTYGWGPRGHTIPTARIFRRSENLSLIPALTMDGYIASKVYKGGINQITFDEFIEHEVLPLCTPFPGPRSIIIMDNCSAHKSDV
jgi:hypothetical protein